jgi:hypothetical protein
LTVPQHEPQLVSYDAGFDSNGLSVITNITTTNSATSTHIWTVWNDTFVQAAGTMQTITQTVASTLPNLISTVSTATTALNEIVWTNWSNSFTLSNTSNVVPMRRQALSPEEAARRREESIRYEAQRREETIRIEAERSVAKDRAEKLLRDGLSPRQCEELAAKGFFTLETLSKGQRKIYRIERGRSRNVKQVDDNGRVIKTLCAHPAEYVPDADTMLAQKLWLETAEDEFLRVANHS